ncbi:MAG: T9SS type A sorting domain-containing protein, partial [Ignavibacteriales bacterium]|nr:T9SS type A sorting domain-containing protein [Ignavibacteriales bacterium]
WNPATDTTKPIKYFVYSSFVKNGEDFQNPLDSTNVLTYKAGQLDNNKEYFFVVRARDGIGNLDSNRVEKSLFVPPLADFNADRKIDGEDLAIFRKAWKEKNASVGDIGPVQGTVPNFKVLRDGKVDFEDIIVFAQMWNWSSDNSSWALSKGNTSRSLDTSTCKVGFVEPLIIKPSRQQAFTLQVNNALDYSTCEISFRYNRAKIRIDSIKIPQCSDVVRLWKLDDKNGKGLIALTSLDQKLNKLINSTSNIRLWISTTEKLIDEPIAITVRTFSDSAAVNSYTTTELHMNWRPVVPDEYALLQNYPNPFNPNTVIEYSLPTDTRVRLAVYNILGQEVSTLADGSSKAGYYTINWNGISNDGSQVGSGVYIYRLVTKDYSATRKMLLLR